MSPTSHESFMRLALTEARRAGRAQEVPVGAVVVAGDRVISRAGNRVERDRDAPAHAEILALRRAMKAVGEKWLTSASLYVTLEPCPLCAGAIILARVPYVFFGAFDPKAGAFGSVTDFPLSGRFNHCPRATPGVLAPECAALLTDFFEKLRAARRGARRR